MADPDVYAYLYANECRGQADALFAVFMPQKSSRCIPPQRHEFVLQTSDTRSHDAREATEQPEEHDGLEDSPCIGLKFSDGAKTSYGVVIGWAPDADIILPKRPGISRYHAALTFNKKNRLVVRDLGSLCGTRVTYDREVAERGYKVDWIVGGHDFLKDKTPILEFVGDLQFRLVGPPQNIDSQQYIDNVTKFRQGTADTTDLFALLKVRSLPETELPTPTGISTPSSKPSGPILWKKKLGQGNYGVVTYVFNVTTGEQYALKEPLKNFRGQGCHTIEQWRKEADIMSCIQYEHIVTFLGAKFTPWPQLSFEYANGGSLDSHPAASTLDEVQYICQLLSALTDMHTHQPPIVHRDIKPEKILCFLSPDRSVRVKFADFGLAKHASYLKTFCGTLKYAAPEIYAKVGSQDAARYTVGVDIWSLALVFGERACGLPQYLDSYAKSTTVWNKAVLQYFKDQPKRHNELIPFFLDTMLHIEPQNRRPASYCYNEALQLFGRLSQRQAPVRSVVSDSVDSLIGELSYRGSSLIESILNSTDYDDETSRRSFAPTPETQQPRTVEETANRSVATIVNGELWDNRQTGSPSHEGAAPIIETEVHQDGARLEGLDLSTRIRHFLGGALVDDENQGTGVLKNNESGQTGQSLSPARKRAKLNDSSPIHLALPSFMLDVNQATAGNTLGLESGMPI